MVYVFLADGFEEIEALTVIDVLRRAEIETYSVAAWKEEKNTVCTEGSCSCNIELSRGSLEVTGAHGITVKADLSFDSADFDACRMIVLPGGMAGTLNLQEHAGLASEIKRFAAASGSEEKYVAAICAAPMVLGALGILRGTRATIYPGMEEYLTDAVPMKNRVVVDGNLITSKGPGTAMEFAVELAAVLKGKKTAEDLISDLVMGAGRI